MGSKYLVKKKYFYSITVFIYHDSISAVDLEHIGVLGLEVERFLQDDVSRWSNSEHVFKVIQPKPQFLQK